jgi:hypothetical protein
VRFLSVTLSLFGIFIFNSPFLRVLAELISARWMVLRFTGKQVNTSYSSEQMLVMLFLLSYHRDCYQKFTMNLSRLPAPPPSIAGSSDFESRRRRSLDPDKIIFRPVYFVKRKGERKLK